MAEFLGEVPQVRRFEFAFTYAEMDAFREYVGRVDSMMTTKFKSRYLDAICEAFDEALTSAAI